MFFFPFYTGRKRATEEDNSKESRIEALLLEHLQKRPDPPAPSEEKLFLISLAPSLERLQPDMKALVKFQIHKLIYEASTVVLNLEPAE